MAQINDSKTYSKDSGVLGYYWRVIIRPNFRSATCWPVCGVNVPDPASCILIPGIGFSGKTWRANVLPFGVFSDQYLFNVESDSWSNMLVASLVIGR